LLGFRDSGLSNGRGRGREIKPRPTPSELCAGGQRPNGLKEKWANKCEVEELLISRIEVFTNGLWIIGGEREKLFDLRPVE